MPLGNIPTERPANPIEGQLIYDTKVNKFQVYMGSNFSWVYFDECGIEEICVVCNIGLYTHDNLFGDHPFCGNNLVYLEWKYEQSLCSK